MADGSNGWRDNIPSNFRKKCANTFRINRALSMRTHITGVVHAYGVFELSTRQKRNSKLDSFTIPAFCALLLCYFAYHAVNGRYGTLSMDKLDEEATHLEFELAALASERQKLNAQVLLLHDGTLERDMLDEVARYTLNVLAPDEVVILRK
jgi:cell division protein FtsB